MADWIKLSTNMFDNRKIKQIEVAPKGKQIILLWVRLICLAGSINDGGLVYVTKGVPYTAEGLAVELNEAKALVKNALGLFEQYKMIAYTDDGSINILGWVEHQNVLGLEKIRDDAKIRQRRLRFKRVGLEYRDNLVCAYCGAEAVTVDHVIPKSKGGADSANNAVPCCKSCNSAKGNKDIATFLNDQLKLGADVDIEGVINNSKLAEYVVFNVTNNQFEGVSNVTDNVTKCVTNSFVALQNKNKNKNKNKKENIDQSLSLNLSSSNVTITHDIVNEYEKKIGCLNQSVGERLARLIEVYGDKRVLEGINRAFENGARTIGYVEKCVESPIPKKQAVTGDVYKQAYEELYGGGRANGADNRS